MALIISTHGNCAFRSEELDGVFRTIDDKTHRKTKTLILSFKSGIQKPLICKSLKETEELFGTIVNIMKFDNNGK